MKQDPSPRLIRFGVFEADLCARELRKHGRPTRIQEQPFQVLAALLERPEELVTREELRQRLWPAGTFVDFENSLNAAVNRVREVLGDSADNPRFIETLPRRGYRFIAPASVVLEGGVGSVSSATSASTRPRRLSQFLFAGAAILVVATMAAFVRPTAIPRVVRVTQLTNTNLVIPNNSGDLDSPLLTDGSRIYFSNVLNGHVTVQQLSARGGDPVAITSSFENIALFDLSPDGSELLAGVFVEQSADIMDLWILPTSGAPASRIGNLRAGGAGWSPDGDQIVYGERRALFVAQRNGTGVRKVTEMACECSILFPRWSPSGRILRFTVVDDEAQTNALWEISEDGGNPRLVFPDQTDVHSEKGIWTPDGRLFVFDDTRSIWVRSEARSLLSWTLRPPAQLTEGPLSMFSAALSRDGRKLFVIGEHNQGEVLRYDLQSSRFARFLEGLSAEGLDFSRDRQWIVYVSYPDGTLWRSRADGRDRLQLTLPPLVANYPRWSPDGSRIVFTGQSTGKPLNVYTINSDGSDLQAMPGPEWKIAPSWSADGKSIAFALDAHKRYLALYDLETRKTSILSNDKTFLPIFSPDGRYIVGATTRPPRLRLFDFRARKWRDLSAKISDSWTWSHDSRYIYMDQETQERPSIQRVRITDGVTEQVADLGAVSRSRGIFDPWFGLDADDEPMVLRDLSSQQIYALDWEK